MALCGVGLMGALAFPWTRRIGAHGIESAGRCGALGLSTPLGPESACILVLRAAWSYWCGPSECVGVLGLRALWASRGSSALLAHRPSCPLGLGVVDCWGIGGLGVLLGLRGARSYWGRLCVVVLLYRHRGIGLRVRGAGRIGAGLRESGGIGAKCIGGFLRDSRHYS